MSILIPSWRARRSRLVLGLLALGLLPWLAACGGAVRPPSAQRSVQPNVATTRPTVFTTTNAGALMALSASTGQPFWQTPTSDHLYGTPAYDASEELVYAAGQSLAEPLYAFDAHTGQQVWETPLHPAHPNLATPPVVDAPHHLVLTSTPSTLVALDAHTGSVVWTLSASPNGDGIFTTPLVTSTFLAVAANASFGGGVFLALDPRNGRTRWSYTLPDDASFAQAAWNNVADLIYAVARTPGKDRLLALNAQTGALTWEFQPGGGLGLPVAAPNGSVYVQSTTSSQVFALDARSGSVIWRVATGVGEGAGHMAPQVVGNLVYLGMNPTAPDYTNGGVAALTADGGVLVWHVAGTERIFDTPGVGLGLVCVSFLDEDEHLNTLQALSASTGATLWTLPQVDVYTPPLLANVSLLNTR